MCVFYDDVSSDDESPWKEAEDAFENLKDLLNI